MTQAGLFGAHVGLAGGEGGHLEGDAFGDLDAGLGEGGQLVRVVGHEADAGEAEVAENGGGHFEAAEVGLEAEGFIGFDSVGALVLESVGTELIHEPDAAAFLMFVDEEAAAFLLNVFEGGGELVAAVAAEAVKDVAGEALRVDAHQGRRAGDIAHAEGKALLEAAVLEAAFEAVDSEVAEFTRETRLSRKLEAKR